MNSSFIDSEETPFKVNVAAQLCQGKECAIYERPGKPSQLVKVLHPRVAAGFSRSRRLKKRLRRRLGVGPHKNFLRYVHGYADAMLRAPDLGRLPPLAHPRGFALTDAGLGLVMQKIRDEDGNVAPTLRDLIEQNAFDDDALERLNAFVAELYAFNIIGTDITPGNILYETRQGRNRFVLVDGVGNRNLIPLRRWSRRFNARALDAALANLASRTGLDWNPTARRLERGSP